MTTHTCNTPKRGKKRRNEAKSAFESRYVGVEYYCGHEQGVFLYHTGDMISSGANLMIEVLRQGTV